MFVSVESRSGLVERMLQENHARAMCATVLHGVWLVVLLQVSKYPVFIVAAVEAVFSIACCCCCCCCCCCRSLFNVAPQKGDFASFDTYGRQKECSAAKINNFRPKSDTLHRQGWPHGANFSPQQIFYREFKISPKTP